MKTGMKFATKPDAIPAGLEFDGVYLDTEKLAPKTIINLPYGMTGQSYRTWRKRNIDVLQIIHQK